MAEWEIIRVPDKKTRSEQGWLHRMKPGGLKRRQVSKGMEE